MVRRVFDPLRIRKLYERGESTFSIAKKLGVGKSTVLYHLRKIDVKLRSRKEAAKLGVCRGRVKIKKHILPKSSQNLTETKAHIFGVLCGDGCLHFNENRRCHQISLEVIDKNFALAFKHSLEDVYEIPLKIGLRKSKIKNWKDKFVVRLCSKEACLDLMRYGDFKTNTWKIPPTIQKANFKIKSAFLKGLFDSDSNVEKRERRITLTSINLNGLKQVQELLRDFSIRSTILNQKVRGNRNKKYILRIQDRNSNEIFANHINFFIERKRMKLFDIVRSYKLFTTSHEVVIRLSPEIKRLKNNGISYRNIAKRLNLGQTTIWKVLKNKY